MTAISEIKRLLSRRIGFVPETLGPESIERAVAVRLKTTNCRSETDYLAVLSESEEEMSRFIDEIVIPESWFFRDRYPFEFLAQIIHKRKPRPTPDSPFRALSAPCAAGEEPYSIAMTLLDQGLPPEAFVVEAVDISQRLIASAGKRSFLGLSFRGADLSFRDQHFIRLDDGSFALNEVLRNRVRFRTANLVDPHFLSEDSPYDVVFCRNVMIYLDDVARGHVLTNLDRLLKPDGFLFVGHVESGGGVAKRFRSANHPGAFAFHKREAESPLSKPSVFNRMAKPRIRPKKPSPPIAPRHSIFPSQVTPMARPLNGSAPSPSDLSSAENLANAGRLNEAEQICQQSLETVGPSAAAFYLMGVIHIARGANTEAEQCLNKAVYLESTHTEAMMHLSLLAKARGDQTAASNWQRRLNRAIANETTS